MPSWIFLVPCHLSIMKPFNTPAAANPYTDPEILDHNRKPSRIYRTHLKKPGYAQSPFITILVNYSNNVEEICTTKDLNISDIYRKGRPYIRCIPNGTQMYKISTAKDADIFRSNYPNWFFDLCWSVRSDEKQHIDYRVASKKLFINRLNFAWVYLMIQYDDTIDVSDL